MALSAGETYVSVTFRSFRTAATKKSVPATLPTRSWYRDRNGTNQPMKFCSFIARPMFPSMLILFIMNA